MASNTKHKWTFPARFRRNAYGWRSQAPIKSIKEAVSEIKKVARKDSVLGGEGAVLFLEKISPAIEHVDSSSGAIGTAVNNAIDALVPIITRAPAKDKLRDKWLERLWLAVEKDDIPYIELLPDHWGELCVTPERASHWADEFIDILRMTWRPNQKPGMYFKGTSACLSSLLRAGRNGELVELLKGAPYKYWPERKWGVKALMAMGKKAEALRFAEDSRGLNEPDAIIDEACEKILLTSGMAETEPEFAVESGMAALRWLVKGHGYEITGLDIQDAYDYTMKVADNAGYKSETFERIRKLVAKESFGERFVTMILGTELGLK